jgi:hypothetical protein
MEKAVNMIYKSNFIMADIFVFSMFVGKWRILKSRSTKLRIQKVVEVLEQLNDSQLLKEDLHQKENKNRI